MKNKSIIIRLIAVLLTGCSLYFLLLSSATLKISDTHEMARTVINHVTNESKDPDLKRGVNFVRSSGLEKMLIDSLPQNFSLAFSYADIYHLSSVYDEDGKISAQDIGLKSTNRLEEVLNNFIAEAVNAKLQEESKQVSHLISIYRYSIFVIILLYILSAILFIFKRYSASIPLLIASLSSFGALWYFCFEANSELQDKVFKGITINLEIGIWLGLIIALILAISWPFILKKIKKDDALNA